MRACPPYSWFYDQTHDNPCQLTRRCVEDVLPRSSLVSMSNCSTGSNRGYDELVPHHIDVVHETRLYQQWNEQQFFAMLPLKAALNRLHITLAEQQFTQVTFLQGNEIE